MSYCLVDGLGLCEHCGVLISMEGMPMEGMNAKWVCPKCEGELTHKSFGYAEISEEKFEKNRWVGPGAKWVHIKPTQNFKLGDLDVWIEAPHHFF